eukprot:403359281
MGCSESTDSGNIDIPEIDMSKLDRYAKFEHSFPFYRTRIDVFEGRVKRFVNGKTSVSLAQLQYAFKDDKKWSDLYDEHSNLVQILKSEYFRDENLHNEINLQALILWGLLLCNGDAALKARVFYDVLQDNLQETISANDKDFPENFDKLMHLATSMVYEYEHEFYNGPVRFSDNITDTLLEEIREDFLDQVYGARAKLTRKDYMEFISTKQNWIFNPSQIRKRIDEALNK